MSNKRLYVFAALAIALLYTVLECLQPYAYDDIGYLRHFDNFKAAPSVAAYFSDLTTGLSWRFNFDNARLANQLFAALVVLPPQVPAVLIGVALFLTLYWGGQLAGVWGRNMAGFGLLCAAYLFLEPWYEFMLCKAFAFNYVLSSAIATGVSLAILHKQPLAIWALLIGFVAGIWHEAFTMCILGGITGIVLVNQAYRTRRTAAWAVGLIAAIVFLASVPGARYRGAGMFMPEKLYQLQYGVLLGAPFYLFTAWALIVTLVKKFRARFFSTELAFIFGAALGGWAIWRCFMTDHRTAWPMILFSCLGLAYLTARALRPNNKVANAFGLCAIAATVLQLCLCVPHAATIYRQTMAARAIASDGSSGHFTPEMSSLNAPAYTLNRVNYDMYLIGGFPIFNVVPAELRDFNPVRATVLPSSSQAWLYKGLIVLPFKHRESDVIDARLHFGSRTLDAECLLSHFTTEAGRFTYMAPFGAYQSAVLGGTLSSIEINDSDL